MDSENDLKTEKKWLEEVKNQHMKGLVLVPVRSENKELRSILQELEANGTAVVLTEKDVKKCRNGWRFLQTNSVALMRASAD